MFREKHDPSDPRRDLLPRDEAAQKIACLLALVLRAHVSLSRERN